MTGSEDGLAVGLVACACLKWLSDRRPLMTFLVIVCPHCGQAVGVAFSSRKGSCPRCSRSFTTARVRELTRVSSQQELPAAVAAANARLHDAPEEDVRATARAPVGLHRAAPLPRRPAGPSVAERLLALLQVPQSRQDIAARMEAVGISPERWEPQLGSLIETAEVYEPRTGTFQVVGGP